ncbi:MAG: hypothetical protein GY751_10850 [Bacteroidetes bacterium]|nr:hypothetical protein [Bacteroidota bacterium]
MDADILTLVKAKVEKKIKNIKWDINHLEEQTKPIPPENSIGRVTRMDAINTKSVNEATLRQSKLKLGRLEHALHRIEIGDATFGQCTTCSKSIPLPRLLLMPESDKCVNCAQ